ncbi:hypothetical protein [Angustibacter luteus]|uniref:DUF4232 domain-containing protein n=1 Tax=Angustibacter luteus TaxID=658456 RepID=A0ABW1JDW4_9ACTN
MGYEVLDDRTPARRGDAAEAPLPGAVEVTDLTDLSGPTSQPRLRRGPGRRGARTAVVAVVALVAGLAAGAWADGAQRDRAPSAAETARLAVLATTDGSTTLEADPATGVATARLQVRVLNLGVGTISVVATPASGSGPKPGETVTMLPADVAIHPGQLHQVPVVVAVDCRAGTTMVPKVPVRSDDGVLHAIPVKDAQLEEYRMAAQEGCAPLSDARHRFLASLTGPVTAPTLVLTNNSDQSIAVSVSTESTIRPRPGELIANSSNGGLEPVPADTSGLGLTFVTTPDLPVRLPAGATQRVSVRLSVAHCLAPAKLGDAGELALAGLPIGDDSPIGWSTSYVDLGPALRLVAAQVCQQDGGTAR